MNPCFQCAFIAMADIGGHGVDEYLESNFQLPEEVSAPNLHRQEYYNDAVADMRSTLSTFLDR